MARKAAAVGGPSPKMPTVPKPKAAGGKPMGATKAKAILTDGTVRGNPLTKPQKGLFGAIAGGSPLTGGGGMSAPAKPRPKPMAIGQRPKLGARTKAAMRGKPPMMGM